MCLICHTEPVNIGVVSNLKITSKATPDLIAWIYSTKMCRYIHDCKHSCSKSECVPKPFFCQLGVCYIVTRTKKTRYKYRSTGRVVASWTGPFVSNLTWCMGRCGGFMCVESILFQIIILSVCVRFIFECWKPAVLLPAVMGDIKFKLISFCNCPLLILLASYS